MNVLDTIQILELQRDDLLRKVASIDMTIETLKQSMSYEQGQKNGIAKKIIPAEYDAKGTLKSKVNFFLKNEFRFLHIREMSEIAHGYEPGTSVDEWMGKFSPTLSVLKREGHIVNIQVGKSLRNTFWGSPKWLDQNGKIISGHEYNKEYVVEAGNSDFKI